MLNASAKEIKNMVASLHRDEQVYILDQKTVYKNYRIKQWNYTLVPSDGLQSSN